MKYTISFLALLLCLGLSSCQTGARMMQSIGRSAGLASYEGDQSSENDAAVPAPEFD